MNRSCGRRTGNQAGYQRSQVQNKGRRFESRGIPHLAKNKRDAPNFLYAALDDAACAPFSQGKKHEVREAIKLCRKSGMWGTRSWLLVESEPPKARIVVHGVKALEKAVFGPRTLVRTWGTRPITSSRWERFVDPILSCSGGDSLTFGGFHSNDPRQIYGEAGYRFKY